MNKKYEVETEFSGKYKNLYNEALGLPAHGVLNSTSILLSPSPKCPMEYRKGLNQGSISGKQTIFSVRGS